MDSHYVKVVPHILDLPDVINDSQEVLFAVDGPGMLKLDANEATIPPSPVVTKSISEFIRSRGLNTEADKSSRRLRRMLSRYAGVGCDDIGCFSSKSAALDALARTYLKSDLEALVVWPEDGEFSRCAAATGAVVKKTEMIDIYAPTVEQIVAQIGPKTRLLFFGNPHCPTGAVLNLAEIVFLLSYAENTMVVVDESYFEFCGLSAAELIKRFPNVTIIRSFSSAFGLAGIGLSYVLTDYHNLKFVNRAITGAAPDSLAQVAAEAALNDISYMADYVRQVNRSKRALFENLGRMGYDFRITAANFCLLKSPNSDALLRALAKNNIYVKSLGEIPELRGQLRLTIGTPSQTEAVLEVLGRLSVDHAGNLGRRPGATIPKIHLPEEVNA